MNPSFLPSFSESFNLRASIFLRLHLAAPWGFTLPTSPDLRFHVVTYGSCVLGGEGLESPLDLSQGDIVLLARGQEHWIADRPETAKIDSALAANHCKAGRPPFQDGDRSHRLICGRAQVRDSASSWQLDLLPALCHFMPSDLGPRVGGIVEAIGASEAPLGDDDVLVLDRLAEALFLSLLGRAAELRHEAGWLGSAARDAQLRTVLTMLHEDYAQAWTIEDLAQRASMSRATLARRFKQALGLPVMTYLSRLRITRASRLLGTGASLETIARQTGYGSAESMRKAFKRLTGRTPAQTLRRRQQLRRG